MTTATRLGGLDALRGIAAITVLGYHVNMVFGGFEIFSRSYLAVDFFFMLSGYVMARTYEPALATGLTAAQFVKKRYLRLWPPMIVGALLGFVMFLALSRPLGMSLAVLATTLLMVPSPFYRAFLTNTPAWSIFFELFANAVHGLLLWKVRTRFLLSLSAVSLLALLIYCDGRISVGHQPVNFIGGFPRVLLPYCIGIALCRSEIRSYWSAWPAYPVLAVSLLMLPAGLGYDLAFVCLACPLAIVLGSGRGAGAWANALGKLSFPLYAVHLPTLHLANLAGLGPLFGVAAAITCALIVTLSLERGSGNPANKNPGENRRLPAVRRAGSEPVS